MGPKIEREKYTRALYTYCHKLLFCNLLGNTSYSRPHFCVDCCYLKHTFILPCEIFEQPLQCFPKIILFFFISGQGQPFEGRQDSLHMPREHSVPSRVP